jgi:hypothetical protein
MPSEVEGDVWRDVVSDRDILKWLKEEFPELCEPQLPLVSVDRRGPTPKSDGGKSQAIQQAVKEIWPAGILPGLHSTDRNNEINEWLGKKGLRNAGGRTINRALTGK